MTKNKNTNKESEPKFKIGQRVWIFSGRNPQDNTANINNWEITGYKYGVSKTDCVFKGYSTVHMTTSEWVKEEFVFATKAEAIKAARKALEQ